MDPKNPKTYVDQSVFVQDEESGYHPIEFRMSSSGVLISRTEAIHKAEDRPKKVAGDFGRGQVIGLHAASIDLSPVNAEQARHLAFALRKCARRMDEISKIYDWLDNE